MELRRCHFDYHDEHKVFGITDFEAGRAEAMYGFLKWVRENGGLEQRVLEVGLISASQLQRMRQNLIVDFAPGEEHTN